MRCVRLNITRKYYYFLPELNMIPQVVQKNCPQREYIRLSGPATPPTIVILLFLPEVDMIPQVTLLLLLLLLWPEDQASSSVVRNVSLKATRLKR